METIKGVRLIIKQRSAETFSSWNDNGETELEVGLQNDRIFPAEDRTSQVGRTIASTEKHGRMSKPTGEVT